MATGQRVGYIRVSTIDQNTERQLADVEGLDRIFTDKASGKNTNRPALTEMLAYVRAGDEVVVHSMDRLGRNQEELRGLVRQLTDKGVTVRFVKENLTFTGNDSPMNNLMLSLLAAFAEFERALIKERQREGIEVAKAKGDVYKGRKPKLTTEQAAQLRQRAAAGEAKTDLAKAFGLSRVTLYSYLNAAQEA